MLQNIKKRNEGFTIIEVLIVLAIAGLIMLIVFLAVPALQRNSRNNQRTSEIGRIGAAVADYITNNNGNIPAAASAGPMLTAIKDSAGNLPQFGDAVPTAAADANIAAAIFSYRALVSGGYTVPSTPIAKTAGNGLLLISKAKCGATLGSVDAGSNKREMVLLYTSENGTNNNFQILCKDI